MKIRTFFTIKVLFFCLFFSTGKAVAQRDSIGTKVIDIVKPYTATISESKKKNQPMPEKDSVTLLKKKVTYTIHSVPVASTFVPEKGKATLIMPEKQEKGYDSYVSLGGGNYASVLGDAYLYYPLEDNAQLELDFQHYGSYQNMKEVVPNSTFSKTRGQLGYKKNHQEYQWGISGNMGYRKHHLYGIEDMAFYERYPLDMYQSFTEGGIKAYFEGYKYILEEAIIEAQGMDDAFKALEYRVKFQSTFKFLVAKNPLRVQLDVDYLSGNNKKVATYTEGWEYANILAGIKPSYELPIDYLTLHLGLGAYYVSEKGKENEFKFFPDVLATYKGFGLGFIPYLGVTGKVYQFGYQEASRVNPYLSPLQHILPSFTQYEVFGGLKGDLSPIVSYDVNARFASMENLTLFRAIPESTTITYPYEFMNTYSIIYDKAKYLGIGGLLNLNITKKFLGYIKADATFYSMDSEKQAWNLPALKGEIGASYQLIPNLFLGLDAYYVGNRYDILHKSPFSEVNLENYFDLNVNANYTFLKRWTLFVNANNIFNKGYERFTNYRVQGFQVLGGVRYQFHLKNK